MSDVFRLARELVTTWQETDTFPPSRPGETARIGETNCAFHYDILRLHYALLREEGESDNNSDSVSTSLYSYAELQALEKRVRQQCHVSVTYTINGQTGERRESVSMDGYDCSRLDVELRVNDRVRTYLAAGLKAEDIIDDE